MESHQYTVSELSKKSPHMWLGLVLLDWAIVAAALYAVYRIDSFLIWIPAVVLIGSRLHAIGVMGHDGAHLAISKNRRVNDVLANVFCFYPFFWHIDNYRKWHMQHHAHLGTDKDSESHTLKRYFGYRYKLPQSRKTMAVRTIYAFLGGMSYEIVIGSKLFGPKTSRQLLECVTAQLFFLCALYALNLLWTLPFFLAAVLFVFPPLNYLRTLFEHSNSGNGTNRLSLKWWQAFFISPHNILEYHYEHHLRASVPSWNLPKLRGLEHGEPIKTVGQLAYEFECASRPAAGTAAVAG